MSDNEQEFDEMEAADMLQQEQQRARSGGLKEAALDVVSAPIRAVGSGLLRSSWLSITSVLGFIFIGLPYINIHAFFLHQLFPKIFCNLGEEWVPKQLKQVAGELGKGSWMIIIFEWIALIIFDLIVLFFVIITIAIIMVAIDYATGLLGGWMGFIVDDAADLKNINDMSEGMVS